MSAELLKKFFRPLINQFLRIRRRGKKTKKNPPIRSFLELSTINSSNSTVFGTLIDGLPTILSLLYFSIKKSQFRRRISNTEPYGTKNICFRNSSAISKRLKLNPSIRAHSIQNLKGVPQSSYTMF